MGYCGLTSSDGRWFRWWPPLPARGDQIVMTNSKMVIKLSTPLGFMKERRAWTEVLRMYEDDPNAKSLRRRRPNFQESCKILARDSFRKPFYSCC